jgi:hypothetical protein
MWMPSFNETLDFILILALVASVCYIIRLRAKSDKSKASFALSLVTSMTTLTVLFLKTITGSEQSKVQTLLFDIVDRETGWSLSPGSEPTLSGLVTAALVAMYLFVIYVFYKLGQLTILRWDGPTTLIVNDLAKNENENDVRLLALAELKRLVARKLDPPASDVVVNWRQRISDPPGVQPWHLFVRQIFSVAFSETEINDSGWRDQCGVWVGQIYISKQSATDATPLLIFLFENKPSSIDLDERISSYINNGASIDNAKLYAIYYEDNAKTCDVIKSTTYDVVVLSQNQLLRMGLRLNSYIRDILKRFNEEKLGGTNATLRDTFVEPHVQTRGDPARCLLSRILSSWLEDSSRRQLAITAEYGRGKSTAMLKFCADCAMRYGQSSASEERIPLLIELRGQNPGESDPLTFISAWAARYCPESETNSKLDRSRRGDTYL